MDSIESQLDPELPNGGESRGLIFSQTNRVLEMLATRCLLPRVGAYVELATELIEPGADR